MYINFDTLYRQKSKSQSPLNSPPSSQTNRAKQIKMKRLNPLRMERQMATIGEGNEDEENNNYYKQDNKSCLPQSLINPYSPIILPHGKEIQNADEHMRESVPEQLLIISPYGYSAGSFLFI